MIRIATAFLLVALLASPLAAQTLRLAVYHTGLGRNGPGLLLRDIRRGAEDVVAVTSAIAQLRPDVLLLLDIDHDRDLRSLSALRDAIAQAGWPLPHAHAPPPNTGLATGRDLDGDGRLGEGDDAQGWGRFRGAGGMALLSRYPVAGTTDHSAFLWRDLPDARTPRVDGRLFPAPEIYEIQRLSTTGHWEVTLETPETPLTIWAWHAGPPVFGGPYGRNRARNADETAFWLWRLSTAPPTGPFVLMGNANLDPGAGDGERAVIRALLAHPALQDPAPRAPFDPGGPDSAATALWPEPEGPGALRVDYLLPASGLRVRDGGLTRVPGSVHALVWADLQWPPQEP
ncbi:endonuclease/exonuclease/phosphatase family protein [Pararhodobacter marinus]|uniref:endonuclease/exonuclease/phosphatase family protein n=1 Tax=Pararhodobacter marinus TaxID=2184063 RepID=UPI001FE3BD13|nr:endonuclease/exonuclease/phosphatase family protein [Pararhodobacter marinus]